MKKLALLFSQLSFLLKKPSTTSEQEASVQQDEEKTAPLETLPQENEKKSLGRRALDFFLFLLLPKKNPEHLHWTTLFLLAAVLGGYFFFALAHVGKFQTADEDLWYADPVTGRIHEYWHAMENKDWERTRINDKPGVTTALLGYWGYKHDTDPEIKLLDDGKFVKRSNPVFYERSIYLFQLPFVIANGILLFVLFWLVWAYTRNDVFALLLTGLVALTPILIGISQIVNPDATIWSTGFVALFAYLVFLKTAHFRWLLIASPLLGLALLSKYGAAILLFFTFFLTFAQPFFHLETFSDRKRYANTVIKLLLGWVLFIAGAIGVFALLMPAAILHPEFIYDGTIGFKHSKDISGVLLAMQIVFGAFLFDAIVLRGRAFFFVFQKIRFLRPVSLLLFSFLFLGLAGFTLFNWGWHNHFNFVDVPFDTGTGKDFTKLDFQWKPFLELKPLVFTAVPAVLFSAFFALLFLGWKRNRYTFLLFAFTTFIVCFYAAILVQNILVHGRYSVLLYPALAGLATIAIAVVSEKISPNFWIRTLATLPLLACSAYAAWISAPFQFNYTSDLLPLQQNVTGAWGLGGYEAAQYLNALPDAENMIIWTDYEGVCPFFKGGCIKGSIVKWYNGEKLSGFDYAVASRRGWMQNESTWNKLTEQEKFEPSPVWELLIGNRPGNFVRIYKMKEAFDSSSLYEDTAAKPVVKKPEPKPVPVAPPKKEKKK